MAAGKAFVFFQDDLLSKSFSTLYDMKNRGQFSDVTIRIDNRAFTVHRIILAAAIPYFHTMFTCNLAESEAKEVTIKELDPAALESLIDFAYTGKVKITSENVQSLLIASEFLQLTKVRDSCCDFLSKSLDPNSVVQVRAYAESLNCRRLVDSCDSYIRQHFDDFCQTKEFLSLPFSFLYELIRRYDLKVKSEESVFEAVMRWIKTDTERHSLLSQLLTGVRMTHLSPQFLIKKASTEKLIVESVPCRNLLDQAKHYHLLPEERPFCCSFTMTERYHDEEHMYLFHCSDSSGLTVLMYISDTSTWSTLLNDRTRGDLRHVLALGSLVYVCRNNNIFEAFDPLTLQWTSLKNCPSPSLDFECVVPCDKRIYWFSDDLTSFLPEHEFSDDLTLSGVYFDIEQNVWCQIQQGPPQFSNAELVSCKKSIYILDGRKRRCEVYNPQKSETTRIEEMCCSKTCFGCTSLDGRIYVCGGVSNHNISVLKGTEEYNPSDGEWRELSAMNTARKKFSLVSYNKKLYAVGGKTQNGKTNSIECYDPKTNKWTSAGGVGGQYSILKAVVTSSKTD